MVGVPQCILYHWVATMPGGGHNVLFIIGWPQRILHYWGHLGSYTFFINVGHSAFLNVGGHNAFFITFMREGRGHSAFLYIEGHSAFFIIVMSGGPQCVLYYLGNNAVGRPQKIPSLFDS